MKFSLKSLSKSFRSTSAMALLTLSCLPHMAQAMNPGEEEPHYVEAASFLGRNAPQTTGNESETQNTSAQSRPRSRSIGTGSARTEYMTQLEVRRTFAPSNPGVAPTDASIRHLPYDPDIYGPVPSSSLSVPQAAEEISDIYFRDGPDGSLLPLRRGGGSSANTSVTPAPSAGYGRDPEIYETTASLQGRSTGTTGASAPQAPRGRSASVAQEVPSSSASLPLARFMYPSSVLGQPMRATDASIRGGTTTSSRTSVPTSFEPIPGPYDPVPGPYDPIPSAFGARPLMSMSSAPTRSHEAPARTGEHVRGTTTSARSDAPIRRHDEPIRRDYPNRRSEFPARTPADIMSPRDLAGFPSLTTPLVPTAAAPAPARQPARVAPRGGIALPGMARGTQSTASSSPAPVASAPAPQASASSSPTRPYGYPVSPYGL